MKATTFVLRQHDRIDEMMRVLERERHLRAPMLTELVEEILSFLTLEEDLFYPRVAAQAAGDREIDRAVSELRHRIAEEHSALLHLLASANDDEFVSRVAHLARMVAAHARRDRAMVTRVEQVVGEGELEEIGARMARFYRESVGNARHGDGGVTIH